MIVNYKNTIEFQIPNRWVAEEDGEYFVIYNPSGEGAITVSLYAFSQTECDICTQLSVMAKRYIDKAHIQPESPLLLHPSPQGKSVISGTGYTTDSWFVKFWIIAQPPNGMLATYIFQKKCRELKKCNRIMESVKIIG